MTRFVRYLPGLAFGLMAGPALAHTGQGDASGLAHGFLHPLTGLDHMLAMVAVGLLAAQVGGRAILLVPLSFLGMMIVGGALGASGVALPQVEIAIALSVAVLGAAVALHLAMPVAVCMALVGVFAVFHGHAHGAEMPEAASGLAYGAGFVAATALLHVVGLGLGRVMGRLDGATGRPALRIAGAAFTAAGLGLLAGAL
ncbi:HupE/UreJ family protein [Methylobacterium sp. 77]|uniref:HupE/UreJ family protein n=1 Tax=Methylobacterium sp. 77 TaxID=1101192 RepID=UPI00036F7E0D|nr:HupE/UreJ family protein [Methylobacterium sp. 77]